MWRWYVDADHHRELQFVHLAGDRRWIQGAFDLYRSALEEGKGDPDRDSSAWIIDFKTHAIDESEVEATAAEYRVQADVYLAAVRSTLGPDESVRLALHFTRPNVSFEMS